MADSLQQLDTVIQGLGTGVAAQLITDVNALIAAVQALPGQDFTHRSSTLGINTDIASLQSLDTSVTTETGQLGAPKPPAPPAS